MTISCQAWYAPISQSIWTEESPVLRFYATYAKDFAENYETARRDAYYADDCSMVMTDRSTVNGGQALWDFVGKELYGSFPKVTREMLSLVTTSDDSGGVYKIHIELITSLYTSLDLSKKVDVPQAFVYTIGRADEGKGTYGLQFRELRCYYDMSLIERAKKDLQK